MCNKVKYNTKSAILLYNDVLHLAIIHHLRKYTLFTILNPAN